MNQNWGWFTALVVFFIRMNAVIDVTSKCNLRCSHCYNSDKYFKESIDELTDLELVRLVNRLAKEEAANEITFLGGEPLLRTNIIDVLRIAKEHGIVTSLTTNGILLGNSEFEVLFKENLVNFLSISIDGSDATQNDAIRGIGVFDIVMKNLAVINKWREKYHSTMRLGLSHCYFKDPVQQSRSNIVDVCKEGNFNFISLFPLVEAGAILDHKEHLTYKVDDFLAYVDSLVRYADKVYPELVFSIEARPLVAEYFCSKYRNVCVCPRDVASCLVFENCVYIKANGMILPCGFVEFKKGFEEQNKGTFIEEPELNVNKVKHLADVYESNLFRDFMANFRKKRLRQINVMCETCKHVSECIPCAYQNEHGELYVECEYIKPKLSALIDKSHGWIMKKTFRNREMDLLFGYKQECYLEECFIFQKLNIDYEDFFEALINLEKKGLIQLLRN